MILFVLNTFWHGSLLQIFFYAGVAIVLLMERDTLRRILFGWYPLLVYLFLISPLFMRFGAVFWNGSVAYYCRQFSLVGIFFSMAYGMMLLLKKYQGWRKALVFLCLCGCICLTGQYVYSQDWITYTRSDNWEKIPQDVVEICAYLSDAGEDITLSAPAEISFYFRQHDASLHMLTGVRDTSDLAVNLASEAPDIAFIMERCCTNGCDYAVAKKCADTYVQYEEAGYTPVLETDGYLLYECSGYAGYWKIYNDLEQVCGKIFYDENKEPVCNEDGFAGVLYEYDDNNRICRYTYLNTEGEVAAVAGDTYAICTREFDENGNIIKRMYYDANGNPVIIGEGFAGWEAVYNEEGLLVSKTFLGVDGLPMECTDGYATVEFEYDEAGNEINRLYFDETGALVIYRDTYVGWKAAYDGENQLISKTYLGEDLQPVSCSEGYATVKYEYNDDGLKSSKRYYDTEGEMVVITSGYAGLLYEYNDIGQVICERYLGEDNSPALKGNNLFASLTNDYDEAGNIIRVLYYDLEDQLVMIKCGCAGWMAEYDDAGRWILKIFVDTDLEECMRTEGYSRVVRVYDEDGTYVEEYYDLEGNIVG